MFEDTISSEEANRARAFVIRSGGGGGGAHKKKGWGCSSSCLGVYIVSFRGQKAWATASEKVELCFRPTAQGPEELPVIK